MKLTKIRIRKYRNIQDSGDVELLENLTCVVGKNQSGKTALLRALHKFNPYQKSEIYDLSRDWPRGERKQKDPQQVVCEATFLLSEEERSELTALTSNSTMDAAEVLVTRNYAGQFEVKFPLHPAIFPDLLHPNEVDALCQRLPLLSEPVGETFADAVRECTEEVRGAVKEGRYDDLATIQTQVPQRLNDARSPAAVQPSFQNESVFIGSYVQKVNEMKAGIQRLPTMHAKAHEYVVKRLPTFVYMDDYREFQGSAVLDQIRTRKNSKTTTAEDDTILMILDLAALDLDRLIEQGNSKELNVIRERQYDLDDAARSLTKDSGISSR